MQNIDNRHLHSRLHDIGTTELCWFVGKAGRDQRRESRNSLPTNIHLGLHERKAERGKVNERNSVIEINLHEQGRGVDAIKLEAPSWCASLC